MSAVAEDPTMVKYLLDQGIEIHEKCYGNFKLYEDKYFHYVNRRKGYLCGYEDLIEIDDADDKDKIFLSGLVYLTTLTDKFSKFTWCPCSQWNRNWLYSFCPFHEEIPVCKGFEERGPYTLDDLVIHAQDKVECRWHNLIYRFITSVIFKTDDNFLPKDVVDSTEKK